VCSSDLEGEVRTIIDDVRASAEDYDIVPRTAEQLAWVGRLRAGKNAPGVWERGRDLLAGLDASKREGVEFRHVAGLLWAKEHRSEIYAMSRGELYRTLDERLSKEEKVLRDAGPSSHDGKRELLYDWQDTITWADLVLVSIALDAKSSLAVISAFFLQADRDHIDRSTEYGGAFFARGEGFEARVYPPRPSQRYGDGRFVAPEDMIRGSDNALFHYHYQVQEYGAREYAGPSHGDIDYAERFGRSCLVMSFVTKNKINVDYYQPNGVRIDLGVIVRPSSAGG